ncbi:serine hydrolase [Eudoraea chungangensis]|uniref:serine hydrolase n=1 Tax=Eudoraea chungangensis TaxID=1481905 RepID=UPI0023EAA321|nr:serine hydrolase [Eudoraea chungangensis]
MKLLNTLSILLLLFISFSCSNSEKKSKEYENEVRIDEYLISLMDLHNIPGLALAIVEGDKIVYENYFGNASIEDSTLVDKNTLFRVFSTTKLITATGIFQLIEDGELKVEDDLSKYLDGLPREWQQIKIKNLLSHSSGLPDIMRYKSTLSDEELMEKLLQEKMQFVTGYQFSYNQTNYWFLAQIIEKITGNQFEEYILKNQFDGSFNGVLFSSNALEGIPNRATRYYYSDRNKKFVKDTNNSGIRGHSGNGLNITLSNFIKWDKQLKADVLIGPEVKSAMWSPFAFTNNFKYQKDDFLHGWGRYYVNGLESYGFSGGNSTAYRFFPKSNTTIMLLSNGYQTPAFDIIINDVARIVLPELKGRGLTLEEDIMDLVLNDEFDRAAQLLKKLNQENPNSRFDNLKSNFNGVGNSHVWNDNSKKALQVFKMYADAYPNSWIASAGLAETYEIEGDTLNALKYYEKALRLNEKNEYHYNEGMINSINKLKNE